MRTTVSGLSAAPPAARTGTGTPGAGRPDAAGTAAGDGSRLILRQSDRFYTGICAHLGARHGFDDLVICAGQTDTRRSKTVLLREQLAGALTVLRHFRRVRRARAIVAVGYVAVTLKLLRRLGLLRYRRLVWYPFFVIDRRWYPLFGRLARWLDTDRESYIVSSRGEVGLYAREMGIPQHRLVWLPFGDWDSDRWNSARLDGDHRDSARDWLAGDATPAPGYYFSGGATNRDYAALAEAWRQLPDLPLVVVCSRLYPEVDSVRFPPNVTVYKDIGLDDFEALVSGAKACILPFRRATGGSGHSVFLQYMRKRKPIVVNDVHLARDYIRDGETGIVVGDIASGLPAAIRALEADPGHARQLGQAAFRFYKACYARPVMESRVDEIVARLTGPDTGTVSTGTVSTGTVSTGTASRTRVPGHGPGQSS